MRKLILFFTKYSFLFLFLALEIISFTLYVNNGIFAKSVFFSSSNRLVSNVYTVSNNVVEFFKLRPVNENLSVENASLKNKIVELENQIALLTVDSIGKDSIPVDFYFLFPENEYEFIPAKIINNSTNRYRNYITLNRGAVDSIRPDMGVVSSDGVVGIVRTVSDRFSTVISLLNPLMHISSKITRNDYVGPLVWDGVDYRYAKLTDIPLHVELMRGDTVVTSGLTTIFPEGIPVGIIEDFKINDGEAYYDIKVKLAVNFRVLSEVHVVDYKNYNEQITLEEANR